MQAPRGDNTWLPPVALRLALGRRVSFEHLVPRIADFAPGETLKFTVRAAWLQSPAPGSQAALLNRGFQDLARHPSGLTARKKRICSQLVF